MPLELSAAATSGPRSVVRNAAANAADEARVRWTLAAALATLEQVQREFAEKGVDFFALVRDGRVVGACSRLSRTHAVEEVVAKMGTVWRR